MATYPTGKVRDVTFSGTATIDGLSAGRMTREIDCTESDNPYIAKHAYGEIRMIHAGTSDGATPIKPFIYLGFGGTDSIGATVFGLNGFLFAGLYYDDPLTWEWTGNYEVVPAPVLIPFEIEATETVAWSVTFADCEERFEPVDLDGALTDTINGREWPNYGGTAEDDFLDGRKATFFEWCPAGSTVTITATCAGGTLTQTRTLTTGCVITYPWEILAQEEAIARQTNCEGPFTAEGDITWSVSLNGVASVADWGGRPVDAQGQYVDWQTLKARATSAAGVNGIGEAEVAHFLAWPILYEGQAALFGADGNPYAGSLNLAVDDVEGVTPRVLTLAHEAAWTADQRYWILTGATNLASRTASNVTEWQGVRAWLTPGSITAAGEAANDWVMMWRGRAWRAGVLQQEAVHVLQDGASAAEWTGATSSGGVLTIA